MGGGWQVTRAGAERQVRVLLKEPSQEVVAKEADNQGGGLHTGREEVFVLSNHQVPGFLLHSHRKLIQVPSQMASIMLLELQNLNY